MERRRSLKRKKEEDVSEQESRLSSMRARMTGTSGNSEICKDRKGQVVMSEKREQCLWWHDIITQSRICCPYLYIPSRVP